MKKTKVIALLLIFVAAVCFSVNFGLWHPWIIGSLRWLWNPLSVLVPSIVNMIKGNFALGPIQIVTANQLSWFFNGITAGAWSILLLIFGLVFLAV